MVVDFKVIKLIAQDYIRRYDHRMAINSADPLLPSMRQVHPDSLVVFEGKDPTTEVIAKDIFDFVASRLAQGFTGKSESGVEYTLEPDRVALERVRVYETATSWAEFSV
jgi:6-pyruvoyltetrahydropterin/6-carboxytetrahydropterin synthase